MCSLICTGFEVNERYSGHRRLFFQELLTQGHRYVGPSANQTKFEVVAVRRPNHSMTTRSLYHLRMRSVVREARRVAFFINECIKPRELARIAHRHISANQASETGKSLDYSKGSHLLELSLGRAEFQQEASTNLYKSVPAKKYST